MSDVDEAEVVDDEVCPRCGTELEPEVVGGRALAEPGTAEVLAVMACPNPNCPSRESDLAPATDGQF